ncbi:hypothetical protein [Streptomyces yaizuensis]|uniref:Uncharacterized protein n=1 Tax=Streptomyces yaizuensis TaxID=2989713 RepID=A0ABQ5P7J6_9ACTN|nr:hypothetical protein [Streptomyces sp. YSPA8]GLF98196.1 hypothetical protein SYYSPA8_27885 [Streptomyces sp. YSPA8]
MGGTADSPADGAVFEPLWDDNPAWGGSRLYDDLATAQVLVADAYVLQMYPDGDEGEDGPGRLAWVPEKSCWTLTDGGGPTPVSIVTRTVHSRPLPPGELSAVQQLPLASEFRVPLPHGGAGGCAQIVVERDGVDGGWAVTDGALSGLRTWVAGEGWRYIGDVGRVSGFRYTREEALGLAFRVAELEAVHCEAVIAADRPQEGAATADRPGPSVR